MSGQSIKERFVALGREDALVANPLVAMTVVLIWQRAKHVVSAHLWREESDEQDWLAAKAMARGAYIEGWLCSHRLVRGPHG